jgi:hypothetical protein
MVGRFFAKKFRLLLTFRDAMKICHNPANVVEQSHSPALPGSLRPSTNRHKWSDLCRTTDENGKKTLLILAWKCTTLPALPSVFRCRCKAPLDRPEVPWRCGDSQHFPVPQDDLP